MKIKYKKTIAITLTIILLFFVGFKYWLSYKEEEQKNNVEWLFEREAGVKYAHAKWVRNLPEFLYDPAIRIFKKEVVIIRFSERGVIEGPLKIDSIEGLKKFKHLELLELNSLLLSQEQIDELQDFYGDQCKIANPEKGRWDNWEAKFGEIHKRYLKDKQERDAQKHQE